MKDNFIDKFYYSILREGRRRQIAEENNIDYTPKTDWELVREVWEDSIETKGDE